MEFSPITFSLHNGRTCTLRSAAAGDAAGLIDYLSHAFGETPYLTRGAGEWTQTLESEIAWIEKIQANPRSVLLVALIDGVIAGDCDLHPIATASRLSYRAGMGISVRRDYWRQGIGSRMMQCLLDCAHACRYEQVELEVAAPNERAIPLYIKYGFQVYGTRPHGLRYPDGSYADEYLMCRML